MPIVFILARDWPLRVLLRAELRERGIQAIGMQTAGEVGTRIASGDMPSVVVLEASQDLEPGLESLARRVPFVVVASGADQDAWPAAATTVLHRPVRIAEVVAAVLGHLRGRPA
ncbi:MAG: response regulator transcription factor [Acidobacteriota bacterium]|nr:response regulator transcription factor [Acidobacteriota bacterium]